MKLTKALVAAAALVAAGVAQAATPYTLGTTGYGYINPSAPTLDFSFTLASPGVYSAIATLGGNLGAGPSLMLDLYLNPGMTLIDEDSITPILSSTKEYSFTGLAAGSYIARFSSTATTAPFEFQINTIQTSAVPEPESIALVLAGLGVVGMLSRRRKAA
jgi:PEP-CTERM motif